MRLMIDTNIILDVLIGREEFYDDSGAVLTLCRNKDIQGFTTTSSITDIFYITRRAVSDIDETYSLVTAILDIVDILVITNDNVKTALELHAKDFEDCLMAVCAKNNRCDGIVTRNKKDFVNFGIKLYSPEELLKLFQ